MNRPRIAYLSALDPQNVRAWSGLHYSAFRQLKEKCGDVIALGPHEEKGVINRGRVYSKLCRQFLGKRFDYTHSIQLGKRYGKYFTTKLQEGKYDLVFAVAASTELAFLETNLPVYYLADATFANVVNYYPFYTKLLQSSLRQGNEIQQRALDKCTKIFLPSEWAATSAVNVYNVDRGKIEVFPLGANLSDVPATLPEHHSVENTVKLLFVGVEWERKGGPAAIEALVYLRSQGWNASLTIVGCNPNISLEGVTIIPFLDKNNELQRKQLNHLFSEADFFILPTTAECFGLVFSEASAMGTPSLARNTGGVGGAVKENVNGFLIPEKASGKEYAEKIISVLKSGKYDDLRKSSRALYDSELNWDAWGRKVAQIISATHPG